MSNVEQCKSKPSFMSSMEQCNRAIALGLLKHASSSQARKACLEPGCRLHHAFWVKVAKGHPDVA